MLSTRVRVPAVAVAAAVLLSPAPAALAAAGSGPSPKGPSIAVGVSGCAIPSERDLAVTATVHAVGVERGVSATVMLAAFEAGWVESRMNNLQCGDSDSVGVFQQRPSQGWGTVAELTDVAYAAGAFFDEAERVEGDLAGSTPGQLAQAVQRSAYPDRYDEAEAVALELLAEVD